MAKLGLNENVLFKQTAQGGQVFFHQPFSHLCCLIYSLRNWSLRRKFCCVLHEASNYNVGVATAWRAFLGTISRLVVIRLCQLIGVQVRGVSSYVCSTYGVAPKKISYLHLFENQLKSQYPGSSFKNDTAVVWLRRGGSLASADILFSLQAKNFVSKVIVLGDKLECDELFDILKKEIIYANIEISEEKYHVSEQRFFQMLQSAKWFISVYPREGFGLSAFQAAYFGCIVLAPQKGAIGEWLPRINYEICDELMVSGQLIFEKILLASKVNATFAQDYIKNEN